MRGDQASDWAGLFEARETFLVVFFAADFPAALRVAVFRAARRAVPFFRGVAPSSPSADLEGLAGNSNP